MNDVTYSIYLDGQLLRENVRSDVERRMIIESLPPEQRIKVVVQMLVDGKAMQPLFG